MDRLNSLYIRLLNAVRQERGATGVEYGIMVAAIAALIIAVVFLIGGKVQDAFQTVETALPTN